MQTLPGAPVPPEEVIGRDELIDHLWSVLRRQSVLLTAERRIGKTSVVRKMCAETPDGIIAYYRDLEGIKTTAEFAQAVFEDVEGHVAKSKMVAGKTFKLLQHLGGAEFNGVKLPEFAAPHWKATLTHAIEDLMENTSQIVVFFWDELPWMVDAIQKNAGETTAMELLDTLRALRQTHPTRLRMVFTGSIGLHHVLSELKKEGYNNAPLNDLYSREVPPLSPEDGQKLASLLLAGEGVATSDSEAVAESIASGVDNIAFYIHHVVDRLKMQRATVTPQMVQNTIAAALTDPHDAWDLLHFQSRVRTYYGAREKLVLRLLDEVARSEPVAFDVLLNAIQSQGATDAEEVRELLRLLGRDHYLTRRTDGSYEFRYGLIRRWWRLERGL